MVFSICFFAFVTAESDIAPESIMLCIIERISTYVFTVPFSSSARKVSMS